MGFIGQSSAMPRTGGTVRTNTRLQDIYLEATSIVLARRPTSRSGRLYSAPAEFAGDG
jgi:hypothetical protein